jgi:serine/threonine protein kinase
MTRNAFGTEGYIAPEMYKPGAQYTKACDIYSLDITEIELLTATRDRNSINSAWIINSELKKLLLRMTSTLSG